MLKIPILYPTLIIAAAIAIRVTLSIQGWTSTNSDESIMNLMALHIAYHGEHPTFFYGQNYMGAFEAYIGAVLFRIFEPSVLVMRLEMVGFYAFFLVAVYALISRLYTRRFALLMLVLFALGSDWMLLHQLQAIGGYPELPLFVALLFLVAYRLVSIRGQRRWPSCPRLRHHRMQQERSRALLLAAAPSARSGQNCRPPVAKMLKAVKLETIRTRMSAPMKKLSIG
jgi:hypothetical protein